MYEIFNVQFSSRPEPDLTLIDWWCEPTAVGFPVILEVRKGQVETGFEAITKDFTCDPFRSVQTIEYVVDGVI